MGSRNFGIKQRHWEHAQQWINELELRCLYEFELRYVSGGGAFWTLDFVFKSTKSCITFSHYTYMISQKTVINKLYFQNLWQFIIKNNWTLEITSSIVICFSLVQDIFMV